MEIRKDHLKKINEWNVETMATKIAYPKKFSCRYQATHIFCIVRMTLFLPPSLCTPFSVYSKKHMP